MGLFDGMNERIAQREREQAERQAENEAAREEFKQKILRSQLFADISASLEAAANQPESSWIALAEDYYDHDPREVSVEKNGDGFKIQRVHYFTDIDEALGKQVMLDSVSIVRELSYGFVISGYKPIDTPRTITTSTRREINCSTEQIRTLVEELVYDRLQQLFPQCEFKGRVTHQYSAADGSPRSSKDLTYYVPERDYKSWY